MKQAVFSRGNDCNL